MNSMRLRHATQLEEEQRLRDEQAEAEQQKADRKAKFFKSIETSTDLNENLQELADFLEETTGATGVYIGKLVH